MSRVGQAFESDYFSTKSPLHSDSFMVLLPSWTPILLAKVTIQTFIPMTVVVLPQPQSLEESRLNRLTHEERPYSVFYWLLAVPRLNPDAWANVHAETHIVHLSLLINLHSRDADSSNIFVYTGTTHKFETIHQRTSVDKINVWKKPYTIMLHAEIYSTRPIRCPYSILLEFS